MVNVLLSSLFEGMDDAVQSQLAANPQEQAAPVDQTMGMENQVPQADPGMVQQQDPGAVQQVDPNAMQLDGVSEPDSERIRKLKDTPEEELSKEDIKLLQKYGLMEQALNNHYRRFKKC